MRILILLTASAALAGAAADELAPRLKELAFDRQPGQAQQLLEAERPEADASSPEWLAAVSWVARGASFVGDWQTAERYAHEAYEGSLARLEAGQRLEDSAALETALGASVEVLGQARNAAGDKAGAIGFLGEQRERFRGSSIETRIQKNLLLIGLEGKPMPEVAADRFVGPPAEIRPDGRPTLYFFWAHWCGDCRAQKPVLERLHEELGPRGLRIVGPTRLYGYTVRGQDASPAEELAYLEGPYQQSQPIPEWMAAPVNQENFVNFGVSTTPTLVLVDREGIVRLYHPGKMGYEELKTAIEQLLDGKPVGRS